MKSQIKQRLRRLGRHRRSEAIWPKGMPRLPERCRRALTPSTSCEVLARECLMFTKLPYVIRRDILILAFGDRVLHMDLLNRAPHPPCGPWNIRIEDFPQQHCKSMAVYKDEGTWHWSGSICHRNPPVLLKGAMGKRDDGAILPWDDHSRADHTRYCDEWPGEGPSKCRIGVMGWLLSCRQAYAEGIDVLYATNTFHMSSNAMIPRLSNRILPQRHSSISSLEMVWLLNIQTQHSGKTYSEESHMESLYEAIVADFPRLRRLFLSIQRRGYCSTEFDVEQAVLQPMDKLIARMPSLKECSISLPSLTFFYTLVYPIRPDLKCLIFQNSPPWLIPPVHVWRPLDGEIVTIEAAKSTYPSPPNGKPNDAESHEGLTGYWIVEGINDQPWGGNQPRMV